MKEPAMPRKQQTMWIMLFLSLLMLSCSLYRSKPAPARPFATQDLLISLEDMPPGWQVRSGPEELRDSITVGESLWIVFTAENATTPFQTASHRVFQYRNPRQAMRIYQSDVLPRHWGETPVEWKYESSLARTYTITCYRYNDVSQSVCEWSGVYEEYIIIFSAWLIPERMTLQDIEHIVGVIETRTAQYLNPHASE